MLLNKDCLFKQLAIGVANVIINLVEAKNQSIRALLHLLAVGTSEFVCSAPSLTHMYVHRYSYCIFCGETLDKVFQLIAIL